VTEDLAAMREFDVDKLPEFVEEDVLVSEWTTVRVKHCSCSVPSRLIGAWVKVVIFVARIVVRYAGKDELDCERLHRRHQRRIDYRHIIWSLVQKPGGDEDAEHAFTALWGSFGTTRGRSFARGASTPWKRVSG
jgi:hypothetical protein